MAQPPVVHNTFVVTRILPHPPERVFAAFSDPAKKRMWSADGHSNEIVSFEADFRLGGVERVRSRLGDKTPFPGVELATEGTYLDIVPDQRIVQAAFMTLGGRTISTAMATIEFVRNTAGTELILTHQAAFFEGSDGPERREEGWKKLLDKLATTL